MGSKSSLLKELGTILDVGSLKKYEPSKCIVCGSELAMIETTFWLLDSDAEWNVPLPFCPNCNSDIKRKIDSEQELRFN